MAGTTPDRAVVMTESAPPAVGPYSQAIRMGDLVFTSGQIALELDTGRLVPGGVASQARQCLKNLEAVLSAAGAELDDVVKVTIFLAEIHDFDTVNEVYRTYFDTDPPARSTVAVAGLPLGARVEIEAIARVSSA